MSIRCKSAGPVRSRRAEIASESRPFARVMRRHSGGGDAKLPEVFADQVELIGRDERGRFGLVPEEFRRQRAEARGAVRDEAPEQPAGRISAQQVRRQKPAGDIFGARGGASRDISVEVVTHYALPAATIETLTGFLADISPATVAAVRRFTLF